MSWGLVLAIHTMFIFGTIAIFVALRPPPRPFHPTFLLLQLAALGWIGGEIGTLLANDLPSEQLAITVLYAGSLNVPALWWLLAIEFARLHRVELPWVTPFVRRLPVVAAAVACGVVFTNPWHEQFLTPVIGGRNEYHGLWLAIVPWFQALVIVVFGIYVRTYRQLLPGTPARWQCLAMIGASGTTLICHVAYVTLRIDFPFDLTLLGGLVTGLLFTASLYSSDLFDVPPFALREVVQKDPTGLLLAQDDGLLTYANPRAADLLGEPLPLERPLGEVLAERLARPGEAQEAIDPTALHDELWAPAFRGGLFRSRAEAPERWLWVTTSRLHTRGRRQALAARIRDVTALHALAEEQRRMSDALATGEAARSTGVLAAGIAHEINNPLGSLLLAAEHARDARAETPSAEERRTLGLDALETAHAESTRAQAILESMLRFGRAEADEPEASERASSDLRDTLRRVCELMSDAARRAGATVELKPAPSLPPLRIAETELEQVFVNLIRNALQAGGRGLRVVLETHAGQDVAVTTVRDDGPGMDREQLRRAFEPFQTGRRSHGGSGLGLSVVHGIVEANGGRVWIDSEPGRGTAVHVALPT